LIFFTDGVVEAFNETGEEFGNERWLSAIRNLPDWDAQQTLQFLMSAWTNLPALRASPMILPASSFAAGSPQPKLSNT